jgi:hypothetical protein
MIICGSYAATTLPAISEATTTVKGQLDTATTAKTAAVSGLAAAVKAMSD